MILEHTQKLQIRFSDTDAMGVVWHGNYLKFFEDGREAFGEKYDLDYLDVYACGFFTPIVQANIDYKKSIHYGDKVELITKYVYKRSAKIVFDFIIRSQETEEILATGRTTQVFLNSETRELELANPEFYQSWKDKYFEE